MAGRKGKRAAKGFKKVSGYVAKGVKVRKRKPMVKR